VPSARPSTCRKTATVEDIEQLHIDAWKMGLKAVAVYRDNCKVAQPLSMAKKDGAPAAEPAIAVADKFVLKGAVRRKVAPSPQQQNL